jgi:hypothetical protein
VVGSKRGVPSKSNAQDSTSSIPEKVFYDVEGVLRALAIWKKTEQLESPAGPAQKAAPRS